MAGKFILTVFAVVAFLVNSTAAVTYTVGDSLGWTVPPSANTYSNWASPITFRVNDILVFNFAAGAHDVATVTKQAYDACNTNSPLTMQTVGPVAFPLANTGELNFICTFGSHCALGQKFSINVTSAAPSPPPTSAPVAPSPPTTRPSPPPSTTPVPVAPSPPMTRPSPPPSTTPVPAAPSPTTTPMPATPPSATPTTPAAPGSPSLPPTVSSMPPTQMPGGPTVSPSASPNSLPSPPPAGASPPGSSSTPPSATPDAVSAPPPPSSATRSLTVVGFVGTLLTIAMGLTL